MSPRADDPNQRLKSSPAGSSKLCTEKLHALHTPWTKPKSLQGFQAYLHLLLLLPIIIRCLSSFQTEKKSMDRLTLALASPPKFVFLGCSSTPTFSTATRTNQLCGTRRLATSWIKSRPRIYASAVNRRSNQRIVGNSRIHCINWYLKVACSQSSVIHSASHFVVLCFVCYRQKQWLNGLRVFLLRQPSMNRLLLVFHQFRFLPLPLMCKFSFPYLSIVCFWSSFYTFFLRRNRFDWVDMTQTMFSF